MTQFRVFDRDKPFYPLVMSLYVQIHGWSELFTRGLILTAQGKSTLPDQPPEITYFEGLSEEVFSTYFASKVTPLVSETELFMGKNIPVRERLSTKMSIELIIHGHLILPTLIRNAGQVLLIAACERTEQYHNGSPLWEFLRHCRNAAAHGGVFNFQNKEPINPAEWRNLRIHRDLQGKLLMDLPQTEGFYTPEGMERGFIAPHEAIDLLWDIEQTYPEISI